MNSIIIEKIKNSLFNSLNLDKNQEINMNTLLKEDLGIDSMSSLTFLISLEEAIPGFTVDPDSLESEHLNSVSTIYDYINFMLSKQKGII
jgi:acyl carrier protein